MRTVRIDPIVFGVREQWLRSYLPDLVAHFRFESLNCWRILRRRFRRFWGVIVRSLCRCLQIVDPILEDCLSCRIDGDEHDKRICVDLRILRYIHSKLVDGRSRACFEWRQHIRRIVVLESLECLWVRRANLTLWTRQLERRSQSGADLVLESSFWLRISINGWLILGLGFRLRRGWWHGCVKGAVKCHLVFVVVLVWFCASYVLQDVWVWHYFWIVVLIRDRVVVTCWMILSDLSVERAVSWKLFGDGHVKDWIAVIWIFFVGIVLFEKICLPFSLGFLGLALKAEGGRFCSDRMRVLLSSSSSDFASELDEFCLSACSWVTALLLSFWVSERRESSTSYSDEAYSCASGWSVDGIIRCVLPCAGLWNACQAGAESGFWWNGYRCGSNARFWRVTMIHDLSLT